MRVELVKSEIFIAFKEFSQLITSPDYMSWDSEVSVATGR
jgi:hypothetical protein